VADNARTAANERNNSEKGRGMNVLGPTYL
jgi:hypothetical protein